jgi:hypothetical protein
MERKCEADSDKPHSIIQMVYNKDVKQTKQVIYINNKRDDTQTGIIRF